jgi:cyclopropane-fatty-acyl-phospholipid synthase
MKAREQIHTSPHKRGMDAFGQDSPSRHSPRKSSKIIPPEPSRSANLLDHRVAQKVLRFLGQPPIRLSLWDGTTISTDANETIATIHFRDRAALYQTLLHPELHWGDLYSEGRVEVDGDLTKLLDAVYQGLQRKKGQDLLHRIDESHRHRKIRNTLHRAADNIHHHYDIGNDFYRLWLDDKAMQYTCAYYPDPEMELEEAQVAKMSHVCRKLQIKPGDQVVEAGCGWGGFSLYMAKHHGATVKAYNISREQVSYARDVAKAEGLADRVEYVLDDYRNISGEFDVFVSVGMLEHVGPKHYPVLGQVINRCMKPGGRGLIHSIGRNRPQPLNAWIERRIFPGAYPPTLREMMDIFESGDISVLDVENLRMHYARTLDAWLQRFEQNADQVEKMMDEKFVRAWRLYLAGSRVAFSAGRLQLFQVLFAREQNNDIPWSRKHQYTEQADADIRNRPVTDA